MTKQAAIGYMIIAAKRLELNNTDIKQLENEMLNEMDLTDEEEASRSYRDF